MPEPEGEQTTDPQPASEPERVIPERIFIIDELPRVKNDIPNEFMDKQTSNEKDKQE